MSRKLLRFSSGIACATLCAFSVHHFVIQRDGKGPLNERLVAVLASQIEAQAAQVTQRKVSTARSDVLDRLRQQDVVYDMLVVGGGATGAGIALDAATRGLHVLLVERDDFSAGTSSKSTKLVHGGVRYLEKAFMNLDVGQYKLVVEALHERGAFLSIAPHLAYELPIMLPIYQWWKVPYYWAGSKAYDILAGSQGLSQSYFLTAYSAMKRFPMLKKDGLWGAMVYYDVKTAANYGALIANHIEITKMVKNEQGKICGAELRDTLTGENFSVQCRGIVNATGPFTDAVRKMDNPEIQSIVTPSSGVHLILPNYFCPKDLGLIDPSTSDGRVVFFLPWENTVIAGTTDSPTSIDPHPKATRAEIEWLLKELNGHLNDDVNVHEKDILAAWSGIRPLIRDPNATNTEELIRNHMIEVSPSGLVTISGGKWTTYRAMAQETVDTACYVFELKPSGPCITTQTKVVGAHQWHENYHIHLIQKYDLDPAVAEHLSRSYGTQSERVLQHAQGSFKKLSEKYPYLEAEVKYAVEEEFACTAVDVLARRTRLAFLDAKEAWKATPKVIEMMAALRGWDRQRCERELSHTKAFLDRMGLDLGH